MESERIIRFLRNELSESEKPEILDWIEESGENQAMFNELKNTLILANTFGAGTESRGLTSGHVTSGRAGSVRLTRVLGYAATVLIIVTAGLLVFIQYKRINMLSQNHVEYVVPNGQTSNVVLSDGTHVYLNSGSTLKYNADYSISGREVFLVGEAYFDVVTDKSKPFIVHTSSFDVFATGTSFNVQAYPNSDISDVTLVSGKVSVVSGFMDEPLALASGNNVSLYRNTNEFRLSKIEGSQYVSWKDGIITFRNARLGDIAKMLERTYNVTIVFADEKTKDVQYNGTMLRYKPIDQILDILELTSDIRFDIETRANEPNLITIK
jgi:ferric-dicitrate binding protein FerR (iron transport regulator)